MSELTRGEEALFEQLNKAFGRPEAKTKSLADVVRERQKVKRKSLSRFSRSVAARCWAAWGFTND